MLYALGQDPLSEASQLVPGLQKSALARHVGSCELSVPVRASTLGMVGCERSSESSDDGGAFPRHFYFV